jgi:hypothetical protein
MVHLNLCEFWKSVSMFCCMFVLHLDKLWSFAQMIYLDISVLVFI